MFEQIVDPVGMSRPAGSDHCRKHVGYVLILSNTFSKTYLTRLVCQGQPGQRFVPEACWLHDDCDQRIFENKSLTQLVCQGQPGQRSFENMLVAR